MTPSPYGPYEGTFPADQIGIPGPPFKNSPDYGKVLRPPHSISVVESYRQQVIRIWPAGLDAEPVDLVSIQGEERDRPEDVLGADCQRTFFMSGNHAFGRLTTPDEDAETLAGLHWRLGFQTEAWVHAVATSPDRRWVERGALVMSVDEEEAVSLGAHHGQDVVFRWDADGLTPVATREGVDVGGDDPVPVKVVRAKTGCPLRCGAGGVCKMWGGPWTSSSISAAYFWKMHRALLLDAFGCDVCEGEGGGGPIGGVELFTPSRAGGWQRGAPRPAI